ncbi:S41 family peptidase [Carboxylicivirga marina]|uniref:S41 family peptidase n=1 Tax=Carboxylicivirga marina TaxID=2800988 RepID=UPI0025957AAC|nr:S41 family peptidase [uncultured Carboxylicivirga sp.]
MGVRKSLVLGLVALLCVGVVEAQVYDKNIQKLQLTYQLVNSLYVDSVDNEGLVEEAIVGMLKSLDPHSVYISADEVAAMNEPLDGSFEGVGIQFNIMDDTLMVVNPVIGGPSEKVGIRAGDRIVGIDGENVAGIGIKNSDVFKYLRGKKGTKVNLNILRKRTNGELKFVVVRDKIPLHSVEAAYMATPKTAYVKISRFALYTHDEFVEALEKLDENDYENLILDLRGNGGGYLKAAIDITDELLDKNKLLVYTEGLNSERRNHHASKKGKFEKGNLVVLIDEGSASASEIVSGAVQDWDRGLVVGRRSFGKGLVQRPFDFPDGSMIRLTIAEYYTPAGRCIQKEYENGVDAYHNELGERYLHGELSNADSIQFDEALEYKTKVSGRTVYGGGGIMPDVFIAVDTSMYSDYYRDLVATGSVNRMVLNYVDNNRSDLETMYKSYKSFNEGFSIDNKIVDLLIKEGEEEDVELNEEELEVSRPLVEAQLKALIARDLFTSSEYFQSINPISEAYIKAIEIVESKRDYSQYLK